MILGQKSNYDFLNDITSITTAVVDKFFIYRGQLPNISNIYYYGTKEEFMTNHPSLDTSNYNIYYYSESYIDNGEKQWHFVGQEAVKY